MVNTLLVDTDTTVDVIGKSDNEQRRLTRIMESLNIHKSNLSPEQVT